LKSFSSTGFHYGNGQYVIFHQFTFGGYAKSNHELNSFVETFYGETKIRTEPVYTGKLFYGICRLVEEGYFKPGSSVLLLHTGGLQYL
jgi:1-aminocyclopropane-1-carboxylate deaminase